MQLKYKQLTNITVCRIFFVLGAVSTSAASAETGQESLVVLFSDPHASINDEYERVINSEFSPQGSRVSQIQSGVVVLEAADEDNTQSERRYKLTCVIGLNKLFPSSIKIDDYYADSIVAKINGEKGAVHIFGTQRGNMVDGYWSFLEVQFGGDAYKGELLALANAFKALFKDFCARDATVIIDEWDMRGRNVKHIEIH